MTVRTNYVGIDLFKLIAAILVITIHTGPLTTYSEQADFLLTSIMARVAVPFFFMAAGFFLFRKLQGKPELGRAIIRSYLYKVGIIYLFSMVIYIPVSLYAGHYAEGITFSTLLSDLIFNGTFYHLWYLPALLLGVCIVYYLSNRLPIAYVLIITGLLYVIGLLGDSYYGLIVNVPFLNESYSQLFLFFDYTRNGLFFAPIFLALGLLVARRTRRQPRYRYNDALYFTISISMLILEGYLVRSYELPRHDSMYLFLLPTVYSLFRWLLVYQGRSGSYLRPISLWIYIIHPMAIVLVRGFGQFTGQEAILITNSLTHFMSVTVVSVGLYFLAVYVVQALQDFRSRGKTHTSRSRAWRELSLTNLKHNLSEVKRIMPAESQLMAVVKADAYGHGSKEVARQLYRAGVRFFAVADISEGIQLRRQGIKGDILVLGETCESRWGELVRYKLQQTVISAEYGDCLNRFGRKFSVHVKIDTGMSRMGEYYENREQILSMYRHNNLQVIGTYSHLAVSDSLEAEDIGYTRTQLLRFNQTVEQLRAEGINPGLLHVQSSYGILNYSECDYTMARAGIALYGVMSHENEVRNAIALRPVLSLRARVALVRNVEGNTPIGYGHDCKTLKKSIIATISIGYADGIPRSLSNSGGSVLIRGQEAKIMGKVCMDYILVDVTDIDEVKRGDIATLIGQDGESIITAEQVAKQCGTITNELLSRIGNRVERVYN